MEEFNIDTERFDAALARMIASSKRDAVTVMKEQAKGIMRYVQAYTPPASKGATGSAARMQGVNAVRSRMKAYGTPAQAFAIVKSSKGEDVAKYFWEVFKAGERDKANAVLREVTGKNIAPFDDGKIFTALMIKRKKARGINYYISDPKKLKDFSKEAERHVGTLAAGWNPAMVLLGLTPPSWISRHEGNGEADIKIGEGTVQVIAHNHNVYTRAQETHMESMIGYAYIAQANIMEHRWNRYIESLAMKSGLLVTAATT